MCGRFSRFTGQDIIESQFSVDISRIQVSLNYNIAPSTLVPVVFRENPVILDEMEWGFIPFWSKEKNPKIKPINTKVESLSKNMFKYSFEKRRCLVPANGFFEWKKTDWGKVPYFIYLPDQMLFAFAGIYSYWRPNEDHDPVYSFSILTTEPNDFLKDIHNRMPVILNEIQQQMWLDPDISLERLTEELHPYSGVMKAHPVSKYVNSPKNEGRQCIEQIDPTTPQLEDMDQQALDNYF